MGVLITDHNVRETLELCSRAVVMASGKEIASGEPDAVLASDLVKELYLGSEFSI
jgi:lipopolysaccharide export system ATP-binding protein